MQKLAELEKENLSLNDECKQNNIKYAQLQNKYSQLQKQQNIKLSLSINISAYHLQQKDFTQRLGDLLRESGKQKCNKLQLEVLESGAIKDLNKVAKIIRDCSNLGIKFALDDFGTGYSSLTYLKALPAAQLKIDQTFKGTPYTKALVAHHLLN